MTGARRCIRALISTKADRRTVVGSPRAPFTRGGRPTAARSRQASWSWRSLGSRHFRGGAAGHADELPHEAVRRSHSERSWQSGCRKTSLRAIADVMRAKPKDHHARTLSARGAATKTAYAASRQLPRSSALGSAFLSCLSRRLHSSCLGPPLCVSGPPCPQ